MRIKHIANTKCEICNSIFVQVPRLKRTCSIRCRNTLVRRVANRMELHNAWKISRIADGNPHWIGDKIGYSGLHAWVRKRYPKTLLCEKCKKVPPIDLANKGIYNRDTKNWEWLCRRCHMEADGRLMTLIEGDKARKKWSPIKCRVCKKVFKPRGAKTEHCSRRCSAHTAHITRYL